MKFQATLFATLFAGAAATKLTSTSKAGAKLLSKARRVNDNAEEDFSWMADYSLKFEGCHTIHTYNAEQNDETTQFGSQHLAKFKLCETSSCGKCSSGGVYMVDLLTFGTEYLEAEKEYKENQCAAVAENCDCQYYEGDDAACQSKCYKSAGLDYCEQEEAEFDAAEYLECKQSEYADGNGYPYYIGPICHHQSTSVRLGLFTDASCTTAAESGTYESLNYYGNSLPYSSKDMISTSCLSCKEEQNNNGDDKYYQAEPTESCTELYEASAKCEKNMSNKSYKDTGSCEYIHEIVPALEHVYHKGGNVGGGASTFFAVFFGLTTVGAACAAAFFFNQVQRTTVNLSGKGGQIA